MAVIFTYCAITFSYVPFYSEAAAKNTKRSETVATGAPENKSSLGNTLPAPPPEKAAAEPTANPWVALGMFFLIILAAPFLSRFSNILGIAIILFGLRQAWTLSQGTTLITSGPYRLSAQTPTP